MTPKLFSWVTTRCLAGLLIGVTGCTSVPTGRPNVAAMARHKSMAPEQVALSQPTAGKIRAGTLRPRSPQESPPGESKGAPAGERVTQVSVRDSGKLAENSHEIAPALAAADSDTAIADSTAEATSEAATLSLGNVLHLADARNPNVAVARERINEAYARVERAETLWLPSLRAGLNYNHHEGAIQDVAGRVFNTNRSAFGGGAGANFVGAASPTVPGLIAQFHLTDAVFQPRIAAHQASAREFGANAARNDTLRDAAVAYLELVRAEHALAIAQEALANTEKLTELTRQYAETGQGLKSDHQRSEAELAVHQGELILRQEGVQVASARLAQVLHADPATVIQSGEPAVVPLDIVVLEGGLAGYVATGLARRPELAEQKHLVCEAVERLRREKYAPLIPSVLLGMSYGGMGGGFGSSIVNSDTRWDADAVAYWEVRNFGIGERAAREETGSLQRQAQMREVAVMDRVAREVVEAHAQVTKRQERIAVARRGVGTARKSYALNLERIENAQGLPIETLQAIQALASAQRAYLNAVIDYNVAQFELSRAIGWFVET